MERLTIYKLTGSGNDFVIVDNREKVIAPGKEPETARSICGRRVSVGADGLILIENSDEADFRMRIVNSDGTEAEMCGNGARCVCLLAHQLGIAGEQMSFETMAGTIRGEVKDDSVAVQITDVGGINRMSLGTEAGMFDIMSLNTGVPHAVILVEDLEGQDVAGEGRIVRYHEAFDPAGTNVNFMSSSAGQEIAIRTYERGVEDETLSCGTGSVACALAHSYVTGAGSPVTVRTRSGESLTISFCRDGEGFKEIMLEGPVRKVFEGAYLPQ